WLFLLFSWLSYWLWDWCIVEWVELDFLLAVVFHHNHNLACLRVHFDAGNREAAAFDCLDRPGNGLLAGIARCPRLPLVHSALHFLVCLLTVRARFRCLPARSARNSSMYEMPSAVWNARSRIDKFVVMARGGSPLGSSGLIDIHIAILSGSLLSGQEFTFGTASENP